ncbi:MAG: D-alanyl-D-alanine carboxypeptidase [Lachnospiraceae bacterium]|nr:D-alanyl-D-alanine carboxypeptidase [Lachnospiraceae bacterium]
MTGLCLADEPKEGELYARSAVLMDADSGRVLYEKNGYEQMPMASTTKIMTCIVALEQGNVGDIVTASSYAAGQPAVHLGMRSGQQYKLEDLLYSLMLESHNDSAVAIAEHIGGSVEGFAELMNQKARDIGCTDTYFITPNGLDATKTINGETYTHSTTARDLARIMKYCLTESEKTEEFLTITRTVSRSFTTVDGKSSYSVNNHNAFLNMMDGALSGKTGFTAKAGYCYVGALERDGRSYIVALLACGWPNNKSYKWSDTRKLMSYGLEEFEYKNIRCDVTLPAIPVKNAVSDDGSLYGAAKVELMVEGKGELQVLLGKEEEVQASLSLVPELTAPFEAGSQAGNLVYSLNGEVLASFPVVTKEGAEMPDFMWYLAWVWEIFLP